MFPVQNFLMILKCIRALNNAKTYYKGFEYYIRFCIVLKYNSHLADQTLLQSVDNLYIVESTK